MKNSVEGAQLNALTPGDIVITHAGAICTIFDTDEVWTSRSDFDDCRLSLIVEVTHGLGWGWLEL